MCEDYEKLLANLIKEENKLMETILQDLQREEQEFSKFYEELLRREKEILKDLDS